ncbi:MAG TPA: DUF58 domain-containing protein [Myxococcota bacterium]|jgi:uncharacterized protein (DUF58 family)
MLEPTERLLWLLVVVIVVGAIGLGVPALGEAAVFILAGLLLAAVADALLAGSPRALSVKRVLPDIFVEGRAAAMSLELTAGRRGVDANIVDSLPPRAIAVGAEVDRKSSVKLARDETAVVDATATFVRRGTHSLGRVAVRTAGPLGLVRRRARLDVRRSIEVLPDVARIGARAERLLRGRDDGGVRRRAPREGKELDSLREYQTGDDPRLVEWKISARRGQLVVRRMRPETRQEIVVCVDAGRHLSGAHAPADGGEQRLDVAMASALTLAAAGLSRGDRVALFAFAGDVLAYGPGATGNGHLRRLAQAVNGVESVAEEADYGELASFVLAHHKRRAMVCILTDVLDEPSVRALATAVGRLRGRHLVVVIAVGDPALLRLARAPAPSPIDAAVAEAAARLLVHRKRGLAALESAGAVVVDAPSAKAAALAVETYAQMKARL